MIEAEGIEKSFGDLHVLDGVSLSLDRRETYALLGPSGCGKTTLVKILAGLLDPDSGRVDVMGRTGIVFQEPRLLPWLTLEENIGIVNKISDVELEEEEVDELLELTGLGDSRNSFPKDLSGGMKQRASLARALAFQPDVLLLDEPFNSLDHRTKKSLLEEFREIIDARELVAVFVTHNIEDALEAGDEIILMDDRPAAIEGRFDTTEHGMESIRDRIGQDREYE